MDLRWPERTGEGFGQTALSRLGRSKCRRLGAASTRSGRADEDNVPSGAPLHRRDDAARGGEGAKCVSPPRRLEIFEGHFLGGAPNALACIVNKDIDATGNVARSLLCCANQKNAFGGVQGDKARKIVISVMSNKITSEDFSAACITILEDALETAAGLPCSTRPARTRRPRGSRCRTAI